MAKKRKNPKKRKSAKSKKTLSYWIIFGIVFILGLLTLGIWKKKQLQFYYAIYFKDYQHKKLVNTPYETQRINKIIERYAGLLPRVLGKFKR